MRRLTAYGSTIGLEFEAIAPIFEPLLGQILVPFAPKAPTFAAQSVLSTLFRLAGTVPITGGAWALPIAVTVPAQLGTAATPGLLALVLDAGLQANWQGTSGGPTPIGSVFLEVSAGILSLFATIRNTRRFRMHIDLWRTTPASTARSSIDATFPAGALLYYTSIESFAGTSHVEMLNCGASLNAHIDRPLAADGSRLGRLLGGTVTVYQTSSNNGVIIGAEATASAAQGAPISLALQNALLVTTPPLMRLVAGSFSATPTKLDQGGLLVAFGLISVLPTLPDPYAANFLPVVAREPASATSLLLATVLWSPSSATALSFSDTALGFSSVQVRALSPSPPATPAGSTRRAGCGVAQLSCRACQRHDGQPKPESLLARRFQQCRSIRGWHGDGRGERGVAADIARTTGGALSIAGLDLVAPCQHLRVFTVPAIQWEPVVTIQNPKVLPSPFPSPAGFLNDGGPTLLGAADVTLVPVAPAPLLDQVLSAYGGGKAGAVLLTLPFGMTAAVVVGHRPKLHSPLHRRRPGLVEIRPDLHCRTCSADTQVSLTAPDVFHNSGAASPSLPGATVQLRNLVDKNGAPVLYEPSTPTPPGGLQLSVLGRMLTRYSMSSSPPVGRGELVPLSRIDLSGYGASGLSAWTDPKAEVPAVVQVRFNMMVGRANHEVVQVKSILHPWGAIVVRTITIDRQDNGQVHRHDSGWVSATPGTFGTAGFTVHPGAVRGAFNIREIRDTTQNFASSGGVKLVGVYFDADIQIDGVVSGASGGLVPSTGQFGWIETAPVGSSIT